MDELAQPVTVLSGVGPKKQQALNKLGINTVEDLLVDYPFRYDDFTTKKVDEIADEEKVTLKGVVGSEPVLTRFGRRKSRLNFRLVLDSAVIMVTFFNQPYLKKQLTLGAEVGVYGKYNAARQRLTGMKLINLQKIKDRGFQGVYRASNEIKANTIEQLVRQAYDRFHPSIRDVVPVSLRQKYRLEPREQMIHDMHFPVNMQAAKQARRSAIFEEFFRFQAELQYVRRRNQHEAGLAIKYDVTKLRDFIHRLPFELTTAQKRVVNEICADMLRPVHMNRLLQGDVGSGKTVVAAIAMDAAVSAGFQAALMAPTEILAEQHAAKLAQLFEPLGITVGLLTGSSASRAAQRRELLTHLANGDIDIIVGTHALIQDPVEFHNLGLIVTDEQHRFGVNQRRALRLKGENPDVLAMTATPIPRTLAITSYGEMDVSVIDELPAGRKPIKTTWLRKTQLNDGLGFIETRLKAGEQAYVISPLIEESDAVELQNATAVYERLTERFANYRVGLLHGQMSADEKNAVMQAFKDHQIDVLVSTTVIEVGVDVPNATTMMILDADHFGLAQLHQLRGRVGRGAAQSYCLLVADPKTDYGKKRLETMTQTTDGFVIAQRDLELRGPGEVMGERQSGLPAFKVGDPVQDLTILEVAQQAAHAVVFAADFPTNPEYAALRDYLKGRILRAGNFD